MNFLSAFQSEVFRPLVTLLIPGALATSSWAMVLVWKFPALQVLISRNHTETAWVLFLIITAAGIIIEDWGARVESALDRRANKRTGGKHYENWYAYLRTAFIADPVGRGYTRSLVMRLKFELGVLFGSLLAGAGIGALLLLGMNRGAGIVLIFLSLGLSAWELKEVTDTHSVLATNRAELLKDIRIIQATKG
jgi:hypothetical protein